jgi:hypothetical protein
MNLSPPVAIVSLMLVALSGCGGKQIPALPDFLGATIAGGVLDRGINASNDPAERVELVPAIVVGFVEENRIVAKRVQALRYKNVFLDLHEVRCKRENSLKGELTGNEFHFFYFADGQYSDGQPRPLYKRTFKADPGRRYLFFLTQEAGVWRSIGDVGEYSIPVNSGKHDEVPIKAGEIGQRIGEILLTPGTDADLGLMAATIPTATEAAEVWASRLVAASLLRSLLQRGEPLRSMACGTLVERFRGQYDCLESIANDPGEPAENRREASIELEHKSELRRRIRDDLKDPARLTYQDFAGDSRQRLREELETLLFNQTDRMQHERACQALSRYFPWNIEPECGVRKGRQ